MSEILVVGRVKIHPGKLDDFKAVVQACVDTVRENDSGTLQYDWFFNEDQSVCVLLERYRDSEAMLEHMANLGETMGALFNVGDVSGHLFGTPSEALSHALAGVDMPRYRYFLGL